MKSRRSMLLCFLPQPFLANHYLQIFSPPLLFRIDLLMSPRMTYCMKMKNWSKSLLSFLLTNQLHGYYHCSTHIKANHSLEISEATKGHFLCDAPTYIYRYRSGNNWQAWCPPIIDDFRILKKTVIWSEWESKSEFEGHLNHVDVVNSTRLFLV